MILEKPGFLFAEFCWLGKLGCCRHSLLSDLCPLHLLPPVANSFSLVSRRHPLRIRDDHGGIVPTYRISQAFLINGLSLCHMSYLCHMSLYHNMWLFDTTLLPYDL